MSKRKPITDSKDISLSPSCINTYITCPKMFEAKYVTFTAPYETNPAAERGNAIHAAIEATLKNGVELAPIAAFARPCVDWLYEYSQRSGVHMYVERGMAISKDLQPVNWYAKGDDKPWLRAKADVNFVDENNGINLNVDWKGLALDTPLPTPDGWSTMGEVAVGDKLYDIDGDVCYVVGKSEVKHIPCYEVTFSNGEKIVCDEEHLWITDYGVMNIRDMVDHPDESARVIPAAGVLAGWQRVPVEPYVFGLWLAAGKRFSGEIVVPQERRVSDDLYDFGVSSSIVAHTAEGQTIRVNGLTNKLRRMGQWGQKQIPLEYFRADAFSRLWLLRGIMAAVGGVEASTGRLYADFVDGRLANQFVELLRTMARKGEVESRIINAPLHGAVFGTRVYFAVLSVRKVFITGTNSHEENKIAGSWDARSHYIESIREVPPVATQCIKVDSPTSSFLCGRGYIPTHNTGKVKQDTIQEHALGLCASVQSGLPKTVNQWVFLSTGDVITSVLNTEDVHAVDDIYDSADAIHSSIDTGVFKAKKGGLCAKYCPVFECPHNKRGAGKSR